MVRVGALGVRGLPERDLLLPPVSPPAAFDGRSRVAVFSFEGIRSAVIKHPITDMVGSIITARSVSYIHVLFDRHEASSAMGRGGKLAR
jgi:hypothetical protein